MSEENKVPTEVIDLPSRGWFYAPEHPLSSGQIDLYHMTARHEDILTSRNLITKGVVIDKLLEALIATKNVKIGDLLIGDKNAIIIGARILGYGRMYATRVECPQCKTIVSKEINLQELKDKEIKFLDAQRGQNEFLFVLPTCNKKIVFRLLTHKDDIDSRKELESLQKTMQGDVSSQVTTRMRYSIVEVEGERSKEFIRKFILDMPARDARAFRAYAAEINPDIDLKFDFECNTCGGTDRVEVPIDHTFFWPE